MIAHVPTVVEAEAEEAPFVFSPRISEDDSGVGPNQTRRRHRRKLMRNLRSVFCCLSPQLSRRRGKAHENGFASGHSNGALSPTVHPSDERMEFIIGQQSQEDNQKKTLVLDLDETLVHSSFNQVVNADYVIPVDIDGKLVDVYVQKRPGLDYFLQQVCPTFEVVIFTASLSKYANPLLDLLDPEGQVRWRLFREACSTHRGTYVKDLCRLGRELSHTVIIDNSPLSYVFQPGNALPITAYLGDPNDDALYRLLPVLDELSKTHDVRECIKRLLGEGHAILSAAGEDVAVSIDDLENRINPSFP